MLTCFLCCTTILVSMQPLGKRNPLSCNQSSYACRQMEQKYRTSQVTGHLLHDAGNRSAKSLCSSSQGQHFLPKVSRRLSDKPLRVTNALEQPGCNQSRAPVHHLWSSNSRQKRVRTEGKRMPLSFPSSRRQPILASRIAAADKLCLSASRHASAAALLSKAAGRPARTLALNLKDCVSGRNVRTLQTSARCCARYSQVQSTHYNTLCWSEAPERLLRFGKTPFPSY